MCLSCLSRRGFLAAAACLPPAAASATAARDVPVEPRMRLRGGLPDRLPVALTLDACSGGFDQRIVAVLVELAIPATIFATDIWLRHNPAGLGFLLDHPALFGIENHGEAHIPAVLGQHRLFGIAVAGDLAAVRREVLQGAASINDAVGATPRWYRGATGHYSPAAMTEIEHLGFRIAGYSLNADAGASLAAAAVAARIGAASRGEIIIAHVNQPRRASGAGVAAGIRALHHRGASFLRLDRLGPADVVQA
jgi:peptidoglycan/xylan/chitin deacetylase (PgdA/CDA1 family)